MKKSKCRRKAVAAVRPPHGLPLLSNQQTCGFFFFGLQIFLVAERGRVVGVGGDRGGYNICV